MLLWFLFVFLILSHVQDVDTINFIMDNLSWNVVGMMSGTSQDGLDLVAVTFTFTSTSTSNYNEKKWEYIAGRTYPYPTYVLDLLHKMQDPSLPVFEYRKIEIEYTDFIASKIQEFREEIHFNVNLIGVHGHTIFHSPKQRVTVQACNLSLLAVRLKTDIVGNFREQDVLQGGQGAPLAPYAEQLFEGSSFLNLGGIANLGHQGSGFDIAFCNLVPNTLANRFLKLNMDKDGLLGRAGKPSQRLLHWLSNYLRNLEGLALSRQQFEPFLEELLKQFCDLSLQDTLSTYYSFLAQKVIQSCLTAGIKKQGIVICTGGGARNIFLLQLLNKNKYQYKFEVPKQEIVDFKEAIIFADLALKFMKNQINSPSGVAGYYVRGR